MEFSSIQWIEICIFIIGYCAIIFEDRIHINKAASAILMATALWGCTFFDGSPRSVQIGHLQAHLANTSQVVLFLLGALAIVEQIHVHGGLSIVGRSLETKSGIRLLVMISLISFFLSSVLDNLTTTIVMIMLLRKCVAFDSVRHLLGGVVVIAANAGGAWTPIGDVTTTMLWIGGKLSTSYIVSSLFIPSLFCVIAAVVMISRHMPKKIEVRQHSDPLAPHAVLVLVLGVFSLISVPIFKQLTGLPPFMGILSAMALMWIVTDTVHRDEDGRKHLKMAQVFAKIDLSTILFFLGILLAVNALETAHILPAWAYMLQSSIPSKELVAFVIGVISAIVDNVPLVAAAMGMYSSTLYPIDDPFWSLIAYCAGTGGSILVIGSAAGVAFMGLERIDFFWYAKRIGTAAFIGYSVGILTWIVQSL